MAVFSGKITKAFFTNPSHDTIQVIYKDGKKNIDHYIGVDYDHPDFRDLIKEYSIGRIEKATLANAKK
jgi:hypothetical protein